MGSGGNGVPDRWAQVCVDFPQIRQWAGKLALRRDFDKLVSVTRAGHGDLAGWRRLVTEIIRLHDAETWTGMRRSNGDRPRDLADHVARRRTAVDQAYVCPRRLCDREISARPGRNPGCELLADTMREKR
jgi:hypothetical protein